MFSLPKPYPIRLKVDKMARKWSKMARKWSKMDKIWQNSVNYRFFCPGPYHGACPVRTCTTAGTRGWWVLTVLSQTVTERSLVNWSGAVNTGPVWSILARCGQYWSCWEILVLVGKYWSCWEILHFRVKILHFRVKYCIFRLKQTISC